MEGDTDSSSGSFPAFKEIKFVGHEPMSFRFVRQKNKLTLSYWFFIAINVRTLRFKRTNFFYFEWKNKLNSHFLTIPVDSNFFI